MENFAHMKRPMSLVLVASTLLFPVFAVSIQLKEVTQQGAAKLSLDRIMENLKDENSLINKLHTSIDKICAPKSQTPEDVNEREIQNKSIRDRIQKEISRYRIKFSVGDLDGLINKPYFAGGVDYKYVVEPAFRNNEQIRKDIWSFKIGVRTPTETSLTASSTIRLTFSRFYGGKNAKWNAAIACPYSPLHTPINSNDIKSKLRDGDGFRLEIIGNTGLGTGRIADGSLEGGINAAVKTEAIFLMDLYKVNSQTVRTRLIGIKNSGEFSIGASAKSPALSSLIRGRLGSALSLGIRANLRKTFPIFAPQKKYPLDTLMVDYIYKFSSADMLNLEEVRNRMDIAESAVEELLGNIRRLGFGSLFFLTSQNREKDQNFGDRLLSQIKITEALSQEDFERAKRGEIDSKDRRVRSLFKGRMQSDLLAGDGKYWISELISKEGQMGNLDSFITSYDENMQPRYFYSNNTYQRTETQKLLGRVKDKYSHDFDLIINADQNRAILGISDIIARTEFQDTDLSAKEIEAIVAGLKGSLPENFRQDSAFNQFFPKAEQTNASLSHRYVFGKDALDAVSHIEKGVLANALYNFLENHPNRYGMHLQPDIPHFGSGSLGIYALEKTNQLIDIMKPNQGGDELAKAKQSYEAYLIAKRDPIFDKYIVGEFFASILPKETSAELFGLNLKFSSSETGTKEDLNLGGKQVSPVYLAISFLKAVISDQSLDLQLISGSDLRGDLIAPYELNRQPLQPLNPGQ